MGNGWCFPSWNPKWLTEKMPYPCIPSRGKPEKKAVFSPDCGNEATLYYDRAFWNPNGITQNPPTIVSIGRKAENWIKSIVVMLYCGDKTARYLLQSQKNSIVCCCTAIRKRCESKDAVLRGVPLGWEPFVFMLQQIENCGYQNWRRTGGKRKAGYPA